MKRRRTGSRRAVRRIALGLALTAGPLLGAGGAAVRVAHAQPADGASELELIRQGVALREQGKDLEAAEVFRAAYTRFRTPRARAQLGLAEQALGRWVDAEANLLGALDAGTDAWIGANRAALEQALSVIRQHLGSLEVMVDVPGTEVLVDGRKVGQTPLERPLRVVAGTVIVQVQAPGHVSTHRHVTISAGQLSRETFQLVRLEPAAGPALAAPAPPADATLTAPADAGPPPRAGWPRPIFYAGVAATLVAAGLATWSGLDVLRANQDYEASPTRQGFEDGRRRERRTNWLVGGTVLLGVSTAAVGLFATEWSGR
jgi:hypothetical protein